jgi:hypothetical protein
MTTHTATKPTYLTAQLRESAPYLKDAGWDDTARLLITAAAEIEHLKARQSDGRESGVAFAEPFPCCVG